MKIYSLSVLLFFVFLTLIQPVYAAGMAPRFGTLQTNTDHVQANVEGRISLAYFRLDWSVMQPAEGTWDQVYISQKQAELNEFRASGAKIVLGLGTHYSPDWLRNKENALYVNQFGDQYDSTESGKQIVNMVFNQEMRDYQASYVAKVAAEFGTDFYAVRAGGGWYGELNYPEHNYIPGQISYWGYDANALGNAGDRPVSVPVNPVLDWVSGAASPSGEAAQFINWYLDALADYQNWQIDLIETNFSDSDIHMLYPSWGIRGDQLQDAIDNNLDGTTPAEQNGEIARGFDFSRFVSRINNPKVVLYTTWVDAPFGDDSSSDQRDWTPLHYLRFLADQHPLNLRIGGENTGAGSYEDMELSITRIKEYQGIVFLWAFEDQLFSGEYATWQNYVDLIATNFPIEFDPADYDESGIVAVEDLSIFATNYKQDNIDCGWDLIGDDCYLDVSDFSYFASVYEGNSQ